MEDCYSHGNRLAIIQLGQEVPEVIFNGAFLYLSQVYGHKREKYLFTFITVPLGYTSPENEELF